MTERRGDRAPTPDETPDVYDNPNDAPDDDEYEHKLSGTRDREDSDDRPERKRGPRSD